MRGSEVWGRRSASENLGRDAGLADLAVHRTRRRPVDPSAVHDQHVVPVRPEQVVEIAFDGLQRSTRYPGGLALRFARVKGYRPDKRADEADTIDTVRAIHAGAAGQGSRTAS